MRFNDFKNIVINGYAGNELKMRNNPKDTYIICGNNKYSFIIR